MLKSIIDDLDFRNPNPVLKQRKSTDKRLAQTSHAVPSSGLEDDSSEVSDALLQELDRARDGVMHNIVATIQAEQYRIMTAGTDKPLVVEGRPWHRQDRCRAPPRRVAGASTRRPQRPRVACGRAEQHLLRLHPRPALDVHNFLHVDLEGLYRGDARASGTDIDEAKLVKGSAQMATVLRTALDNRIGWRQADLSVRLGSMTLTIRPMTSTRSSTRCASVDCPTTTAVRCSATD